MIDTCFATHHLLFRRGRQQHAVDQQRRRRRSGWLAEHKNVGSDARRSRNRRAGRRWCWIPTATASATLMWMRNSASQPRPAAKASGTSSAISAPSTDPTKDTRLNAAFYGIGDRHGWHGLGQRARLPRRHRAAESGSNPPRDRARGILRGSVEQSEGARVGVFAARHGYRPQRRGLGGAGKRTSGQLRPAQMQRSAERADGDRAALSGRLDALSDAGTELQKREGFGQRRFALLRLGGPVRYAGLGQEHAHHHRQFIRFADRAGERQVRGHARSVSARLLRQRDGRAYRRRESRLERQRRLDHLGHPHAIPQRDRKRDQPKVVHFQIRPNPLAN